MKVWMAMNRDSPDLNWNSYYQHVRETNPAKAALYAAAREKFIYTSGKYDKTIDSMCKTKEFGVRNNGTAYSDMSNRTR